MNAGLGRKVLDHVTAHREQFDMATFGYGDPHCRTVACLAGWTLALSGYRFDGADYHYPDGEIVRNESTEARRLLSLTDDEFYGDAEEHATLFGAQDDDHAIGRFRALVEAAEAAAAS